MLHECTHDGGGQLGPERNPRAGIVLVLEVVHLFGDDVGGFAYAEKDSEFFDDRRHDVAVPRKARFFSEYVDERAVPFGVWTHHVAHALERSKFLLCHGRQGYRSSRSLRS